MASSSDEEGRPPGWSTDSFRELRKRAKSKAGAFTAGAVKAPTHEEALALLEELRIYQIQLEMQNEDLRRVQADLEASRARYFDLYDLAPVGYITVNEQGAIVESNLRAATLFGVTHSSLSRRHFSQLIASSDEDIYYLARRRLLKAGVPQVCELKMERTGGFPFWARLEMSLSRDDAPRACRIVIIDITERKLAEQRFDAFMDHSPALASIVDEEGRYVYVNPAMQRHTGRAAEAWVGKTFSELWPAGVAQELKREHTRALMNGETTTGTEMLRLGSHEREHQVLRFPFAGANGKKLVGSISVDVHERHRLEQALREANATLGAEKKTAEEATSAKSQFLSAMSHEIRTPLNGVIGMAGLLLHTDLTAEQLGYARIVSDSAESLLGLVNDILDLSKIEAGKLELDETPFDMESLIEDALSLMAFKAQEKSLELASWYPTAAPRHFLGDAGRLRQILMNLLSNAVKFTHSGYVLVEAEVSEQVAGLCIVRLSIQDTGIGVSKEKLSKLFTRFGQADGSIARRFGGTGLGLVIVKQVVELMGGEVGVSSKEGEGSTFYCRIPLKVQQTETGPARENGSLASVSARAPAGLSPALDTSGHNPLPRPRKIGPFKVLVTDDNPINQKLASALLSRMGCEVDIAEDGVDAVKKVGEKRYDLVFMDCVMPEMDGFAATLAIRRLAGRCARVPIVALTASATTEDREHCLAVGMDDFLTKPIRSAQLEQCLSKWLK